MDYKNGKIYTIRSPHTEKVYIGGTTQPLFKRFYFHKKNLDTTAREIIALGDAYIELLEEFPCENKNQLCKREGELIRATKNCINKRVEGLSKIEIDERKKIYRDGHIDEKREYDKKYNDEHRTEKREYDKNYNDEHRTEIAERKRKYDAEHKVRIAERKRRRYAAKKALSIN